jgi:sarcosine oxidase, subunit delta
MKAPRQEWLTDGSLPMLRIACPYCGVRDEPEFSFGGPTHITRPPLDCDDLTWTSYLYERENPAGVHFERWLHVYGCGRWFNMARNTVTHEVLAVYKVGEPKPTIAGAAT